jgi:perosamine synthetase
MLYTCLVDANRDAVLDRLERAGIEARVYFPPVHLQPIFTDQHRRLPATEAVAARMLSIPMHSQLTSDELAQIADALEEAVGHARLATWRTLATTNPGTARTSPQPAPTPRTT